MDESASPNLFPVQANAFLWAVHILVVGGFLSEVSVLYLLVEYWSEIKQSLTLKHVTASSAREPEIRNYAENENTLFMRTFHMVVWAATCGFIGDQLQIRYTGLLFFDIRYGRRYPKISGSPLVFLFQGLLSFA